MCINPRVQYGPCTPCSPCASAWFLSLCLGQDTLDRHCLPLARAGENCALLLGWWWIHGMDWQLLHIFKGLWLELLSRSFSSMWSMKRFCRTQQGFLRACQMSPEENLILLGEHRLAAPRQGWYVCTGAHRSDLDLRISHWNLNFIIYCFWLLIYTVQLWWAVAYRISLATHFMHLHCLVILEKDFVVLEVMTYLHKALSLQWNSDVFCVTISDMEWSGRPRGLQWKLVSHKYLHKTGCDGFLANLLQSWQALALPQAAGISYFPVHSMKNSQFSDCIFD